MVIYFTGTGNSQYIAEAIADRLNDEVICANDLIKNGNKGNFKSDKPFIISYPVYLSTVPKILVDFLKDSSFEGSKDAYFIGTCKSSIGVSSNILIDLCKEVGLNFRGVARILMPQNYIALFKMTEDDECKKRYDLALKQADEISEIIKNGKDIETKIASKFEKIATVGVELWYLKSFTLTKNFCATDKCSGCGLCSKICPTNSIEIQNGKPVWVKKKCVHCMACINRCPSEAIEYGKKTADKKRYQCIKYKAGN